MKKLMLVLTFVLGAGLAVVPPALAASDPTTIIGHACDDAGFLPGCDDGQKLDAGSPTVLQKIVNVFLFSGGIVAFIFVIIGGLRYITSTGDSTRIESAKNTLLYAIIGLIVTIVAVPISAFVIHAAGG